MRDTERNDTQWVIYHDRAWDALVEQGYVTVRVEKRGGVQWALMLHQPKRNPRY